MSSSAMRIAHPLVKGIPEPWAAEWGEDRYGPFMGVAIGDVVQRMRWIPPGPFVMGSPRHEAGRWDDEEQHDVVLTAGYWLADAPCIQAMWEAIMGKNPSRFVTKNRPVECVSWDDCKSFIEKLGKRVPGFHPRLPTEAEWERACRAGTTTATWVGDLTIVGANNAPVLDAIAWYAGNSGRHLELEGEDSSAWREKQYEHVHAGSHPVASRDPNPFGLFDMLGNVYEWCEDRYSEYPSGRLVDPCGAQTGSTRVIRGGSWYSYARSVRAARRDASSPHARNDNLGFRLAGGQPQAAAAEPQSASERSRRR